MPTATATPFTLTWVPGEASYVATVTMITEALKLFQVVIADQSPDEKSELSKMRLNLLKIINGLGDGMVKQVEKAFSQ